MSEKQEEMDFPLTFTDKEWGKRKLSEEELDEARKKSKEFYDTMPPCVKKIFNIDDNSSWNPNHLHVFNRKITDHLPKHFKGSVSKVQCPFCGKGVLKLTKIKPRHSGGLRGKSGTRYHVGNDLTYSCTEEGCDATFSSDYIWMHVD